MTGAAGALQDCSRCYRYPGIRCKIVTSLAITAAVALPVLAARGLSAAEPFSIAAAGSAVASADWSAVMTAAIRFVLSAETAACPR